MKKRVSARGVIITGDEVYVMFRRRMDKNGQVREYYVIPGGGQNANETLEENVIREIKEELSVTVKVKGYLGIEENHDAIAHFFACELIDGTPTLGGEELERCTESNYYEVRKVKISDINQIDIFGHEKIINAYHGKYDDLK